MMSRGTEHRARRALVLVGGALLALAGGAAAFADPLPPPPRPIDKPIRCLGEVVQGFEAPAGENNVIRLRVTPIGELPIQSVTITADPAAVTLTPGSRHIPQLLDNEIGNTWTTTGPVGNKIDFTGPLGLPAVAQTFEINYLGRGTGGVPAADVQVPWTVTVSFQPNGPRAICPSNADVAGFLIGSGNQIIQSWLRVLKVEEPVAIVGPKVPYVIDGVTKLADATDGTVTQGQGVDLATRIRNVGSSTLTVNGTFFSQGPLGGSLPVVDPGRPSDNSATTSTSSLTIAPGQVVTFTGVGTVGDSRSLPARFRFRATTPSGNAVVNPMATRDNAVQLTTAVACTVVSPGIVRAGQTPVFSVTVDKTHPGAVDSAERRAGPAVYGHIALRVLSNVPFATAPRLVEMGRGEQSAGTPPAITFTMPSPAVTGSAGDYPVHLTVNGRDENGHPLDVTSQCSGGGPILRIDNSNPTVVNFVPMLPQLGLGTDPDARQYSVKPVEEDIDGTDVDSYGWSGQIVDSPNCHGEAKIASALLREYDSAGALIKTSKFASYNTTPTGDICDFNGKSLVEDEFGTPVNPRLDDRSATIDFFVTVDDGAGHTGSATTRRIRVDREAPTFAAEVIARDKIKIVFSECVHGTTTALDWLVGAQGALDVTLNGDCTDTPGFPHKTATLTLARPLESHNARPMVHFSRVLPESLELGLRILGRDYTLLDPAGRRMPNGTLVTATDKVGPPAPALNAITPGRNLHTNSRTPLFYLDGGYEVGDFVCVRVLPGATANCREFRAGDTKPFPVAAAEPIVGGDGPRTVELSARDASLNNSPAAQRTFVFDTVGPRISDAAWINNGGVGFQGVTPDGSIRVTFNDTLVKVAPASPIGRSPSDNPNDWRALDNAGREVFGVIVEAVDACDTGASLPGAAGQSCVLLSLSDGGTGAVGNVKRIQYKPLVAANGYRDLAGNLASDSQVSVRDAAASGGASRSSSDKAPAIVKAKPAAARPGGTTAPPAAEPALPAAHARIPEM